MKDIKIDLSKENYSDLVFENGDISITDSIVQAITIRLRWFLGEFKYNENFGVPYYEDVFIKNPNMNQVRRDIAEAILNVSEVDSVESVDLNMDDRHLKVRFSAIVKGQRESGEVIVLG